MKENYKIYNKCDNECAKEMIFEFFMRATTIEEKALSSTPQQSKWWFRYVGDSYECLKKRKTNVNFIHTSTPLSRTLKCAIEVLNQYAFSLFFSGDAKSHHLCDRR